jgi:hypothetical protein
VRRPLRPWETADSRSAGPRPATALQAALVGLAAVVGACLVVVSVADAGAFGRLIAEDGPVEYGSAVLWFAAAAVTLASLAVTRRLASRRVTRLVYGLATLFFVVSGGEEISWGQRLIGFRPPDELVEINKQAESNIHNIGSISVYANAFLLLTLVVFLVVPLTLRRDERLRRIVARYDLPVVARTATHVFLVVLAVWAFLGIRFGTLGFHPFSVWGHYTQMDDEVFELGAAYAFLALACLELARRLSERSAPKSSS